jgi:hypothetical protein
MTSISFDDFARNLAEHLHKHGYRCLLPDGTLAENADAYRNQRLMKYVSNIAIGQTFGLLASMSQSQHVVNEEVLRSELISFAALGTMVGISFVNNGVQLALLLNADGMSDAAIIGRFERINDAGKTFKKYTPVLMKTIFRETRSPLFINVVTTFSDADKAGYFSSELESKCKYTGAFKGGIYVYPLPIDLATPRVISMKRMLLPDPLGLPKAAGFLLTPHQN